jgi:hypothetical protein
LSGRHVGGIIDGTEPEVKDGPQWNNPRTKFGENVLVRYLLGEMGQAQGHDDTVSLFFYIK